MAIQNFISGGFYGKLGSMVGQRWHNKRIIRVHVIPYNPRTEKQQANRQMFALATALAQEAYNINKGSPLWDTTNMGQFSQMVGLAKRRLQAGMSPAHALPLYPEGHVSNITLTKPIASWSNWPSTVTITDASYVFDKARTMEIIIQAFDERQNQWVFINDTVEIPPNASFSYAFNTENRYSLPKNSSIQAVTTDDAAFNGASITLPPFSIPQPAKALIHTDLSWRPYEYDSANNTLKWTLATGLIGREPSWEIEFRGFDTTGAGWVTSETLVELEPNGTALYRIKVDEYTFPNGSYIAGGSYTWTEEDTADFSFSWDQHNFIWP